MKRLLPILTVLALVTSRSLASDSKSEDVRITCVPVYGSEVLSKGTTRHFLMLTDGTRNVRVWLGDGDEPELSTLKLKKQTPYTFVLDLRPDWAGAGIVQPGATSPSGFLKHVKKDGHIVWEDVAYKAHGVWK